MSWVSQVTETTSWPYLSLPVPHFQLHLQLSVITGQKRGTAVGKFDVAVSDVTQEAFIVQKVPKENWVKVVSCTYALINNFITAAAQSWVERVNPVFTGRVEILRFRLTIYLALFLKCFLIFLFVSIHLKRQLKPAGVVLWPKVFSK